MSKDMMRAFELYQPDSVEGAVELLGRFGTEGWALAGGNDTLDWFKDRAKYAANVVDLSGVEGLSGITETGEGIEIGAMTTLTEIETSALIQERYSILADSARRVASPQIRNTGTIGGNVNQDARCWYYRYGTDCYRAGGTTCYADTPQGQNREHCLWGADRCVAVTPSDTAPALVVLDARMVIRNADGEREVAAEDYFIGPEVDIERMTVLEPGDLLTTVRLPATWAGARFYFEKSRDRQVWDFALGSVASAAKVSGGVIEDIRVVVNGMAPTPVRLTAVEDAVRGQQVTDQTAEQAGQLAIQGVRPLAHNGYKVSLLKNLVKHFPNN